MIADPAIMLMFLCCITGAGLVFRWATSDVPAFSSRHLLRMQRQVDDWANARYASRRTRRSARGAEHPDVECQPAKPT